MHHRPGCPAERGYTCECGAMWQQHPAPPPTDNSGMNFMGYTIGWVVLLSVALPALAIVLCCGFFTFAAATGGEPHSTPTP